MPIYEYQCDECGKIEEVMQKISDKPLTQCRHCSGKLNKLISQSSFHLKGTGWYVTDYAGKASKQAKNESNDSTTSKAAGSGESKKNDSKKLNSDD